MSAVRLLASLHSKSVELVAEFLHGAGFTIYADAAHAGGSGNFVVLFLTDPAVTVEDVVAAVQRNTNKKAGRAA